jgi:glycosyltransferase involved in cell wall biosynthesis
LTAEKGVDTLLDAVRILDRRGERWRLDIIGEGPRRDACRALAEQLRSVRMCVLSEVPYGAKFFDLLGQYHAVVVPSLSDEQPRIVFDAFSQALPVLASSTDGLTPHVKDGETGWLFEANSAEALARVLSEAAKDVARLRQLGLSALAAARGSTHEEMHRRRWRILVEHFGAA